MSMSYVGDKGKITVRWEKKEDDNKMSSASEVNVWLEVKVKAHPTKHSLEAVLEQLLKALGEANGVDGMELDTPMTLTSNPVFWYNEVMESKGH